MLKTVIDKRIQRFQNIVVGMPIINSEELPIIPKAGNKDIKQIIMYITPNNLLLFFNVIFVFYFTIVFLKRFFGVNH